MEAERGFALVFSLMILLMVTLLALAAINTSVLDIKIGSNDLTSKKAFYVAEAGWNEFTARFKTGEITDILPTGTDWKFFIATNAQRAAEIGYAGNPPHYYVPTIQNKLDYAVEIKHLAEYFNGNFNVVTKAGHPVYVVTSHGWHAEGRKTVEVLLNQSPGLDPPSALYSKTSVFVKGSSTIVDGKDYCGVGSKPGIITTTDTIGISGGPVIDGSPPQVLGSKLNLPLDEYVSYLKDYANYTYTYTDNKTLTGMDWGSLRGGENTSDPLRPTGNANIVYFNMNAVNTIKLAGGCHGEGILLVNGSLDVNGGFAWYGIVIATGALTFSGGGEKNITGGVLAGNMTSVEVDVAGNVGILYCSDVHRYLRQRVPTFRIAHWRKL